MTSPDASRHSGRPPAPSGVPEPTFAERARTLLHVGRQGALATLSRRPAGGPFASLMPYAVDGAGRPLFLISSLAVHTQNLQADPRASLLVVQPGWNGDPLAAARVTLLGRVVAVPAAEIAETRTIYLRSHQNAAHWADFSDFSFQRLQVEEIYYVGGFGAMGWVAAADYAGAAPDPLADAAPSLLDEANRVFGARLKKLASARSDEPVEDALLTAVDRLGFRLRVRTALRTNAIRIAFPKAVAAPDEVLSFLQALP
jgi:heme iron utilization protein